ncbi:putative 2-oxoglutarate dehydrogenase E1 component DHKTD1, mitochondrial [Bulinus truncatus]|nr:putative 2-oxoglutarate dehydrogenase E1 component DHKTD1, mitochondrial [Bulinus truncatus]
MSSNKVNIYTCFFLLCIIFEYVIRVYLKKKYQRKILGIIFSGVYGYNPQSRIRTKSPLLTEDNLSLSKYYTSEELSNRLKYANIVQFIDAYRNYGHLKASLDPLKLKEEKRVLTELDLKLFGIDSNDKTVIPTLGLLYDKSTHTAISDLVQILEKHYCSSIAAEFQHLQTMEERIWFAEKFESRHEIEISETRKTELAKLLLRCEAFDHFVGTKFSNVKRYGGEGGESMMACFDEVFRKCALNDIKDIVICMPHRGRLNFMTCLLNFPPVIMFRKMKGLSEIPAGAKSVGDVLSHLYTSVDLSFEGKEVHVSLIPNPSHLEANNPVAVGKARSKLQTRKSWDYTTETESRAKNDVLCLQVHGDASFSGQGIVAETFCFASVPHFETGGSVHLIVNNQVGFTTESARGRSSIYCSDIAKVNGYPVIHVNGDYPEDVLRATSIALDYRQTFHKDVIIDYICFRKWGHNEMDEPSFTQPRMYQAINNRQSIPDMYSKSLLEAGLVEEKILKESVLSWTSTLNQNLEQVSSYEIKLSHLQGDWSSLVQAGDHITTWDTGVPEDVLKYVGARSVTVPQDMKVHQTIKKTHIDRRIQRLTEGTNLDWATSEALAFGSLLHQEAFCPKCNSISEAFCPNASSFQRPFCPNVAHIRGLLSKCSSYPEAFCPNITHIRDSPVQMPLSKYNSYQRPSVQSVTHIRGILSKCNSHQAFCPNATHIRGILSKCSLYPEAFCPNVAHIKGLLSPTVAHIRGILSK